MNQKQTFPRLEAQKIKTDYRCASCWGHLLVRPFKDESSQAEVYCPTCGSDKGLVFRGWVEQRLQRSIAEALEVRSNLRGVLPITSGDANSESELVRKLGF